MLRSEDPRAESQDYCRPQRQGTFASRLSDARQQLCNESVQQKTKLVLLCFPSKYIDFFIYLGLILEIPLRLNLQLL